MKKSRFINPNSHTTLWAVQGPNSNLSFPLTRAHGFILAFESALPSPIGPSRCDVVWDGKETLKVSQTLGLCGKQLGSESSGASSSPGITPGTRNFPPLKDKFMALLLGVGGVTFGYFGSLDLIFLPLELEEVFLNKNLLNSNKSNVIGIWGSWTGKSGHCLAWEPKFKSQVPHSIRKELTPSHYPLTSTQALWVCTAPPHSKYIL